MRQIAIRGVGISLLLSASGAAAEVSPFSHESGLAIDAGGGVGVNSDDLATDYDGNHPIGSLQVGYRLHVGLEGFAMAGVGLGGHEATFGTWGVGLRQRIKLGRVEPFVEAGIYEIGDETSLPLALGVGAGVDVQVSPMIYTGASFGHFFSNDSDETGGLDWSGRGYVGVRLGAGSSLAR